MALVLNQAANFDLARTLSDRSRRGLPCDRSRRPGLTTPRPLTSGAGALAGMAEAHGVERGVGAAAGQQLSVPALLDDAAAL